MRHLLSIFYGIFILILTCTESIKKFSMEGRPSFLWNPDPDFKSFLDFHHYPFDSPAYITQKSGHILAFFLFALISHAAIKRASAVFILSTVFGICPEIAQLFFSRTGCLLDAGYNVLGITLYFIFHSVGQKLLKSPSKVQSG
ncbi:hypothetical protein [Bacillus sp. KH172YL63]|uniref:hypothetical protein n=1 Tax=Bacillus sp. KH172YL63 TaxID=2709784 RepID=UPI001566D871|nr:hypothetical protein [Bacillus sp. KH172YL63]